MSDGQPKLAQADYEVMDVLMDGPDTISSIAHETDLSAETVRRCINKLKFAGYVRSMCMERDGAFRPTTVYELVRTRKAA